MACQEQTLYLVEHGTSLGEKKSLIDWPQTGQYVMIGLDVHITVHSIKEGASLWENAKQDRYTRNSLYVSCKRAS